MPRKHPPYKSRQDQQRLDEIFDKIHGGEMAKRNEELKTKERKAFIEMYTTNNVVHQRMMRGEIFYISREGDASPDDFCGGRPGIIVSADLNNELNNVVQVVFLTKNPLSNLPTTVKVSSAAAPLRTEGTNSYAVCDQICTVNKRRVGKYVGQCSEQDMRIIDNAMLLGLQLQHAEDIDLMKVWRDQLAANPYNEAIDKIDEDTEKELHSVINPTIVNPGETKNNNTSENKVVEIREVIKEVPVEIDIKNHPEYIKLQGQFELMQQMYMQLLTNK